MSNQKVFKHQSTAGDANCRKATRTCNDVLPNHLQSPFYQTRTMFLNYTGYTEPLSYEEWLSIDDDYKAAVLYLQFFEQITLAWYKLKTDAAIEEDCVSEVLQYLLKNVPVIENTKSKFSPGYIYRIVYNCIYCKSIDPYKGQTAKSSWYNNTTSPYISCEHEEINLFDHMSDKDSDIADILEKEQFWALIESLGDDTLEVVDRLLNGPYPRGKKNAAIIEELKIILLPYVESSFE